MGYGSSQMLGACKTYPRSSSSPPRLFGEPVPLEAIREIGPRSHAHETFHAFGPGQGGEQHHPSAHARADEHLGTLSNLVQNRERVPRPLADGSLLEFSRGFPVSAVIEANKGASDLSAMGFERARLRPAHVRAETAQEHQAGRFALQPEVRERSPVFSVQKTRSGVGHFGFRMNF